MKGKVKLMNIRLISSKKKRKFAVIRWTIFSLLIWVVFIFTTTGYFLKPNLLIPMAICISMSEDSLVSAFVGFVCGILSDIAFGKLIGSTTLILVVSCVCISLLFTHLLRQNLINISVLTLVYSAVHFSVDYFFSYMIWHLDNEYILLKRFIIPEFILTVLSVFLVYPIIRLVRKNLTLRQHYVLEENPALIKD